MLEVLEDKRLIFVTGKGGVGKSTVVAAMGRALARQGRQTLVVETDAYSAMKDLYDVELADSVITPVDPPLHAVNLLASECIVEIIARIVPSKRIVRSLLNNRVARLFFNTAPGIKQFAILDQIREFLDQTDGDRPRWDTVIVDLPASGHAATFLSVPKTLRDIIKVGPAADIAERLAEMVGNAAKSAIVAVCLPEEMPVNETIEFEEKLESSLGRGLTVAFANMVHRAPLEPRQKEEFSELVGRLNREALISETISGGPDDDRVVERVIAGNVLAMDWHERDERYLKLLHERLSAPVDEIPVYYETDGDDIVECVVEHMLNPEADEEQSETLAS